MRQFCLLILHLGEQNLIPGAKELIKMIRYHKYVFMRGSIFDRFRKYETETQIVKVCLGKKGYTNRGDWILDCGMVKRWGPSHCENTRFLLQSHVQGHLCHGSLRTLECNSRTENHFHLKDFWAALFTTYRTLAQQDVKTKKVPTSCLGTSAAGSMAPRWLDQRKKQETTFLNPFQMSSAPQQPPMVQQLNTTQHNR